jgi:hypothetical protein
MWTSLNKIGGVSYSWLGEVLNSLDETASISGGDCVALKGKYLQGASCELKTPYICEKNSPG